MACWRLANQTRRDIRSAAVCCSSFRFSAASEEDTDAAAAIRKIVGLSTHPDSRTEIFKDAGHAASMFAKQQDLEPDIVIWFRANLPVAGYGLPPAIR
jgi:hypothetical protein